MTTNRTQNAGQFTRYHVPNLARALHVLEFLANHPTGSGISEMADALSIPRNSAFRIAATLADYGYLLRDDSDATYRLSPKLLHLGHAAVDHSGLVERSLDVLRQLRDATGETTLLAVMANHQGVALEQVPSLHPIKVMVEIGRCFPMYTAAPGKAILAFLPEAERNAVIEHIQFTRFTTHTITSRAALLSELGTVYRQGYALDRGEEDPDIRCVGAPIRDQNGHAIAAIWITAPETRLQDQDLDAAGDIVARHAERISQRFGHGWQRVPVPEQTESLSKASMENS